MTNKNQNPEVIKINENQYSILVGEKKILGEWKEPERGDTWEVLTTQYNRRDWVGDEIVLSLPRVKSQSVQGLVNRGILERESYWGSARLTLAVEILDFTADNDGNRYAIIKR